MSKLDAVFFDLDGTFIDSAPDFHRLVNQLRAQEGMQPIAYAALRPSVSHGGAAVIRSAFPELSLSRQEQLLSWMLDEYAANPVVDSQLFPGIQALLDWLEAHEITWGIVTNKPARYSQPILEALKLTQRCHSLICPEDVSRTKPDPEGLFLACQQTRSRCEHSLYVGDHKRDIVAGRSAGMRTIAAGYGYLELGEDPLSWCSDFAVDCSQQLLPLLDSLTSIGLSFSGENTHKA